MKIAGYAALFGAPDMEGDIVFAGAFRESLARRATIPLLVRHDPRLRAGVWTKLQEDARGLLVEGLIDPREPAAALAQRLIVTGVDGLSIGFAALQSRQRADGGRDLHSIELFEVSLVETPMAPQARLFRARSSAPSRS